MESWVRIVALVLFVIPVCVAVFPVWAMRRRNRFSPLVENRLRLPGESAKQKLIDLYTNVLGHYSAMFAVIAAVLYITFVFNVSLTLFMIAAAIGASCLCYLARKLYVDIQKAFNYRTGADGEAYTGQELNLLARDGAFVFHDIPYKYGNIDHIVIGYDNIFVVETKAVRKPAGSNGKKQSQVEYDGARLRFPHFTTDAPLRQAQCHADWLARTLNEDGNCRIPVVPVVALPGWYIDRTNCTASTVRVINPKRGNSLRKQIGQRRNCDQFKSAVRKIEQLARVDSPLASITDPDAAEHYNLWTNEPRDRAKFD